MWFAVLRSQENTNRRKIVYHPPTHVDPDAALSIMETKEFETKEWGRWAAAHAHAHSMSWTHYSHSAGTAQS
jgi:hypothetical protein